jgi:hypothetical protein
MSAGAVAWALKPRGLKPVDKIILVIFADTIDAYSGELSAPLSVIARAAEVSVRTAHDSILRLCALDLLEKRAEFEGGLQKQNTYAFGAEFRDKETLLPLGSFFRPDHSAAGRNRAGSRTAPVGESCRVEEGFDVSPEQQDEVVTLNGNSNLSNARRKKRAYLDENPPSVEDFLEFAKSDSKVDWLPSDEVELAHNWYVAHGWCQANGSRLVEWKPCLRSWAIRWKKKNPREYTEIIRLRQTAARAAQPFVSEIAQIRARQREAAARSAS